MLAIIPARGGSKGLPGKNLKLLNGKPLIVYSIEAALAAKSISKVIVSTEDRDIADVAVASGAEVPFLRPEELAKDDSLAVDAYIYTVEKLKKDYSAIIDNLIVLQPTSPLRTKDDIENAIALFNEKNADSVISYTKEHHPIYWHKHIDADKRIISIFEDKLQNRQELKITYYPNGAIFVFKYDLIKQRSYFSEKSYAYIMPRKRSVDIDTIDDFMYAEFLLQNQNMYEKFS